MLRPRRLPFLTTLHGTDITLVGQDPSFLPITRFAIEESNGVSAVSEYLRAVTQKEFKISKPIEVIHNFVNCERYQRRENAPLRQEYAPRGEFLLAHLSNFRPVKRIPDVIEAFARVRREHPVRLLLIGDGPERATAEYLVRQKGISEDVLFLGKQDAVHDKLAVVDLFLLPSDLESFGLAALEAMACEVPVIASDVGGLRELITPGVDGCLVAPRDIDAVVRCALELLGEPSRLREMGQRARETAHRRFCSTLIVPRYEAVYEKVVEEATS
jgi:N-acetyl-alpha-D-glucosaminyl L-malate synthase BshA